MKETEAGGMCGKKIILNLSMTHGCYPPYPMPGLREYFEAIRGIEKNVTVAKG